MNNQTCHICEGDILIKPSKFKKKIQYSSDNESDTEDYEYGIRNHYFPSEKMELGISQECEQPCPDDFQRGIRRVPCQTYSSETRKSPEAEESFKGDWKMEHQGTGPPWTGHHLGKGSWKAFAEYAEHHGTPDKLLNACQSEYEMDESIKDQLLEEMAESSPKEELCENYTQLEVEVDNLDYSSDYSDDDLDPPEYKKICSNATASAGCRKDAKTTDIDFLWEDKTRLPDDEDMESTDEDKTEEFHMEEPDLMKTLYDKQHLKQPKVWSILTDELHYTQDRNLDAPVWHDSSLPLVTDTHLFNPDHCNYPTDAPDFEDIRYEQITCHMSNTYCPQEDISATYLYPTWGKITPEKVDNYLQVSSHPINPAAKIRAVFLQNPQVQVNT